MIDRRILIADDDRRLRASLVELLGGLASIVQAETGRQAIDLLRAGPIDLALLDMHMPEVTGLEVLTLMREETLGVPCIVCSGDLTDGVRDHLLREGALAVLRKPVEPVFLRSEVLRALSDRRPDRHPGRG
jgi:CheY-like chemotaxis protein